MTSGQESLSAARLKTCWRMYANREHTDLCLLDKKQAEIIVGRDENAVKTLLTDLDLGPAIPNEELRMNLVLAAKFKENA